MGALSPLHMMILAIIALLLFGGRGKLSGLMSDAARGVKAFRDGLKEDAAPEVATDPQSLTASRDRSDAAGA